MQIRHERPMSDLSYQVRAPLKLTLANGRDVAVQEWSLSSIRYPEPTDILPKTAVLTISFQGVEIQFPVHFRAGNGSNELIFEDLTGRQRETLAVFYRSILSGKMASTADVITSLDTPVDLVPMGETEEEITKDSKGKQPRVLRVIWNVAFYAILACVIFGLIGGQIWGRLSHVTLEHARVVAPIVELRSAEATYVDRINVHVGDTVRQGDVLIRLSNPDRNARLDDIRSDIAKAEDKVREARSAYTRHIDQLSLARAPYLRAFESALSKQTPRDFIAGWDLAEVYQTKAALDTFDAGLSQAPGDFHGTRLTLKEFLADRKDALARLKRVLGTQKAAASSADIIALSDGVIKQIDVFRDQFLARGAPVLTIESNAPRTVKAWLNEARAAAIHTGMAVKIRFNDGTGSRTIPGTIADISASIDPAVSPALGIIVTAKFDDMDITQTRDLFRPDAPVQLRAVKSWAFDLPWVR